MFFLLPPLEGDVLNGLDDASLVAFLNSLKKDPIRILFAGVPGLDDAFQERVVTVLIGCVRGGGVRFGRFALFCMGQ